MASTGKSTYEEVRLEQQSFAIQQVISDRLARDGISPAKIAFEMRDMTERMAKAFTLRADFWSEKLESKTEKVKFHYKCPADWWQHVKQRFAPKWALKRWPVKMQSRQVTKEVTFTPYAVYPKFAEARPNDARDMRFVVRSSPLDFIRTEGEGW